jgi:hypothetical protein
MRAPTPEPTRVVGTKMVGENRFELGCLSANPQPFNFAGTFVSFCMKSGADITLNIYSALDGKLQRQIKAGNFRPGSNNQIFYNALDDNGRQLQPGAYVFELVGEKNGYKETRNATFTFKRDRTR